MAEIKIVNKETLSDKKYLLENITFERADLKGNIRQKKNEVYHRPDAVAVLLVNEDEQKFLLTKQFRLPAFLNGNSGGYIIETCAGLIDEGETAEQAAKREVEEETGYQVDKLVKIGAVYSSVGGITEFIHLFTSEYTAADKHGEGGGKEGEGEDIELIELSFSDAREQLKHGIINDAKTMILLQHHFLALNNPG